jgi:hypothetical protein
MPRRFRSFLSMFLICAVAPLAAAEMGVWSAAGVTGIVDESGLNLFKFNSTGSVSIKSSVSSGTLELRFPIQAVPDLLIPQQGDCPELRVNLRDTGAGARVVVRLMALSIFPGSGTQVTSLAEIDSNSTPPPADATQYRPYQTCINKLPPGSEFLFDKSFFSYYVEAQLTKSTATANPGLMSVQICPSQDACDP